MCDDRHTGSRHGGCGVLSRGLLQSDGTGESKQARGGDNVLEKRQPTRSRGVMR